MWTARLPALCLIIVVNFFAADVKRSSFPELRSLRQHPFGRNGCLRTSNFCHSVCCASQPETFPERGIAAQIIYTASTAFKSRGQLAAVSSTPGGGWISHVHTFSLICVVRLFSSGDVQWEELKFLLQHSGENTVLEISSTSQTA